MSQNLKGVVADGTIHRRKSIPYTGWEDPGMEIHETEIRLKNDLLLKKEKMTCVWFSIQRYIILFNLSLNQNFFFGENEISEFPSANWGGRVAL